MSVHHRRKLAAMATFTLTKEHIAKTFGYLEEIDDLQKRNIFFNEYIVPDVTWEIAGTGHVLGGTSYNLADLQAKTFIKLRKKLTTPIKFTLKSIILEPGSNIVCVETQGHATRLIGKPYNNDYIWLTTWSSAGKMVHIRSYFDTKLAEDTLQDPDAQQNHES
ncbi:hypothetical protein GE09DRAFT_1069295 [Coniochaeta sp. 2T2.1]|nr:hypothetical protein GE09DRAFT_1069295 [Coniochaeta sp. 2T2.1]